MKRSTVALTLLVCGSFALAACSKKEETTETPILSAAPPTTLTPVPTQSGEPEAPPADSGAANAAPEPAAPPPAAAPAPATAPKKAESIDACCAALKSIQSSGLPAATKTKAQQASMVCSGIAKLVKDGKTSRASAMTQIRSAMVGASVPAACQ